jgi:hypothetical protein
VDLLSTANPVCSHKIPTKVSADGSSTTTSTQEMNVPPLIRRALWTSKNLITFYDTGQERYVILQHMIKSNDESIKFLEDDRDSLFQLMNTVSDQSNTTVKQYATIRAIQRDVKSFNKYVY